MRSATISAALLLFCVAALLGLRTAGGHGSNDAIGFVAPAAMDLPDYLRPATDPAFGTSIVRITKPGPLG
ncbi:hypothetical protein EN859_036950, partial [Mesorhizobium sp. M00.F.Ca.ET.216.01.1.1]